MASKQLIVVGGPNGAGKTTFVEEYLRRYDVEHLGADLIAKEMAPDHPESVAIAAGREFLERVHRSLAGNESVIVETTLSGKSFTKALQLAAENGFEVTIHFAFTDSPETSVKRVAKRVKAGGHHVPDEDVRRRFARSLRNFWLLYRPLADFWVLAYNGETSAIQVANGGPNALSLHDEELFQKFLVLAGVEPNDPS